MRVEGFRVWGLKVFRVERLRLEVSGIGALMLHGLGFWPAFYCGSRVKIIFGLQFMVEQR